MLCLSTPQAWFKLYLQDMHACNAAHVPASQCYVLLHMNVKPPLFIGVEAVLLSVCLQRAEYLHANCRGSSICDHSQHVDACMSADDASAQSVDIHVQECSMKANAFSV